VPALNEEPAENENEYERQRAERIRRNAEMLNALKVPEAAANAARAAAREEAAAARGSSRGGGRGSSLLLAPPPRRQPPRPRARGVFQPTRASARARGLQPGVSVTAGTAPPLLSETRGGAAAAGTAATTAAARAGGRGTTTAVANGGGAGGARALTLRPDLLTIEEYWRQRGGNPCRDPLVSDGSYKG